MDIEQRMYELWTLFPSIVSGLQVLAVSWGKHISVEHTDNYQYVQVIVHWWAYTDELDTFYLDTQGLVFRKLLSRFLIRKWKKIVDFPRLTPSLTCTVYSCAEEKSTFSDQHLFSILQLFQIIKLQYFDIIRHIKLWRMTVRR